MHMEKNCVTSGHHGRRFFHVCYFNPAKQEMEFHPRKLIFYWRGTAPEDDIYTPVQLGNHPHLLAGTRPQRVKEASPPCQDADMGRCEARCQHLL